MDLSLTALLRRLKQINPVLWALVLPSRPALQPRICADLPDLLKIPLPTLHRSDMFPSRNWKLLPSKLQDQISLGNAVAAKAAIPFLVHTLERPLLFFKDFPVCERVDMS